MIRNRLCKIDMIDYLRNKCIILLLTFSSVLLLLILFVSVKVDGGAAPKYKYFKSIEIQSGDTLWSIAEEYMSDDYESTADYIREVKFINNIESNRITTGNYLTVPYYSFQKH